MREIKFRAFHKKIGYICNELIDIDFDSNNNMSNIGVVLENDVSYSYYDNAKTFKLMQYTGLKDKNNVDIYEGDVLYLENWNDHIPKRFNIPLDETRKVFFNNGCFCIQELNSSGHCSINHINPDFTEIIGNIYENPELLE